MTLDTGVVLSQRTAASASASASDAAPPATDDGSADIEAGVPTFIAVNGMRIKVLRAVKAAQYLRQQMKKVKAARKQARKKAPAVKPTSLTALLATSGETTTLSTTGDPFFGDDGSGNVHVEGGDADNFPGSTLRVIKKRKPRAPKSVATVDAAAADGSGKAAQSAAIRWPPELKGKAFIVYWSPEEDARLLSAIAAFGSPDGSPAWSSVTDIDADAVNWSAVREAVLIVSPLFRSVP